MTDGDHIYSRYKIPLIRPEIKILTFLRYWIFNPILWIQTDKIMDYADEKNGQPQAPVLNPDLRQDRFISGVVPTLIGEWLNI